MAQFCIAWNSTQAPRIDRGASTALGLVQDSDHCKHWLSVGDPVTGVSARSASPTRSWLELDWNTGVLRAQVDTFGCHPFIIVTDPAATGAEIVIASDLGTLVTQYPILTNALDSAGLVELLSFGQNLGTRTPWRGIQHIPGGTRLHWTASTGLRLADPPPLVLQHAAVSPNTALETLLQAVDGRLRAAPDTVIMIDGGVSTRLLLACALHTGHQPELFCGGNAGELDRIIASRIAADTGLHLHTPSGPLASQAQSPAMLNQIEQTTIMADQHRRIVPAGGGAVPISQGQPLAMASAIPALHARPMMTSTGADTFCSVYYDQGTQATWRLCGQPPTGTVARRGLHWAAHHLEAGRLKGLAQAEGQALAARAQATLVGHLMLTLGAGPDLARGLDALYLRHRVGRFEIACQQLLDGHHARMHPFLDPAVVAAFSGQPMHQRLNTRFFRWAIAALSPSLAAVPWDRTGRPLSGGLTSREYYAGLTGRFALKPQHQTTEQPQPNANALRNEPLLPNNAKDRLVSRTDGGAIGAGRAPRAISVKTESALTGLWGPCTPTLSSYQRDRADSRVRLDAICSREQDRDVGKLMALISTRLDAGDAEKTALLRWASSLPTGYTVDILAPLADTVAAD